MSKEITFTATKFKKLKTIYNKAVKEQKESFTFEGDEWLTQYAKHVIEYLTPKFK